MTHIHLPDGVLPAWLWIAGWILAAGALAAASYGFRGSDRQRRLPLVGVVSALVLVAMSVEIVPIAYHVNLTVVAGALLGPGLGIVAAFVVSTLLALLGHGGITVVGLNTVLLGAEIVLGWALVRGIGSLLGRRRAALTGGVATVLTLAIATGLLVGVVALAGPSWEGAPQGALDPETLRFELPEGGLLAVGDADEHSGETHTDGGSDDTPANGTGTTSEDAEHADVHVSVGRFATVVFVLGPIGWLLEALITAGILGFVSRVRPDLVDGTVSARRSPLPGDAQGGR